MSIVTPYGSGSSTCGYCSPPGERSVQRSSLNTTSLDAHILSCAVYQGMIDRGWRRSGTYCYKPDLRRSCCPQYTIRLSAGEFKPSKSQRKIVNRWNEFVLKGDEKGGDAPTRPRKGKGASNAPFCLVDAIHAGDRNFVPDIQPVHDFEVTLSPSTYTDEKFKLYERYQSEIHNDFETTPAGFERFLVDSPLVRTPITYSVSRPQHLPGEYGSYHQMYRLDGKLIAMGVIDILPKCVSSVYFIYDPTWQKHSFGKLSALHEISLAQEMHAAGAMEMMWLYMGFYIHSCQKMRYKGEYAPSYLLDPEQYSWFPLEECVPLLDKYKYACFSNAAHSLEQTSSTVPVLHETVSEEVLREMRVVSAYRGIRGVNIQPLRSTRIWRDSFARRHLAKFASCLGPELAKEIILDL